MSKVFISYCHVEPDQSLAGFIEQHLKNHGHDVFVDTQLRAGTKWTEEIENQLKKSEFFVVLLSQESILSEMLLREVQLAHEIATNPDSSIVILPLRVNFLGPLPYELGAYLDHIQAGIWQEGEHFETIEKELTGVIEESTALPYRDADNYDLEVENLFNKAKQEEEEKRKAEEERRQLQEEIQHLSKQRRKIEKEQKRLEAVRKEEAERKQREAEEAAEHVKRLEAELKAAEERMRKEEKARRKAEQEKKQRKAEAERKQREAEEAIERLKRLEAELKTAEERKQKEAEEKRKAEGEGKSTEESPRCFISYSWDSEEHRAWVRELATRLRESGINAILDQFFCAPGTDLTKFMDESIKKSKFVLLVCTQVFAEKADAGVGGVGYEKAIVTGEIFAGEARETKFVPLLREGDAKESLPSYLKSRLFVDFREDGFFDTKLEELLRHLYGEPLHPPPPLGTKPDWKKT